MLSRKYYFIIIFTTRKNEKNSDKPYSAVEVKKTAVQKYHQLKASRPKLTEKECAEILDISERTLYRWKMAYRKEQNSENSKKINKIRKYPKTKQRKH